MALVMIARRRRRGRGGRTSRRRASSPRRRTEPEHRPGAQPHPGAARARQRLDEPGRRGAPAGDRRSRAAALISTTGGAVLQRAPAPRASEAVSGSDDGSVPLWDCRDEQPAAVIPLAPREDVRRGGQPGRAERRQRWPGPDVLLTDLATGRAGCSSPRLRPWRTSSSATTGSCSRWRSSTARCTSSMP